VGEFRHSNEKAVALILKARAKYIGWEILDSFGFCVE